MAITIIKGTHMATRPSYPMLSVEEAQKRVLSFVSRLAPERTPILDALGRVLSEDIVAPEHIPPHDNSAMDGYAVRHGDLAGCAGPGAPQLQIIGDLAAGAVYTGSVGSGEALRIMTGAPMPDGADTVVRFEDTERQGGQVIIQSIPSHGRNVRYAGEDVRAGEVVLRAGMVLRPPEIGMLASVGQAAASVYRQPRVAVLATGDEVWPIDEPMPPGKIRNINSYSNAAQALAAGGQPIVLEIARDQEDSLAQRLSRALELGADLILTSGGVSVGDFDLVKQVLSTQGEIDFWWVNMKPGKPMAFGTLDGVPLLALPGNPVAAMISFHLFGVPAIKKMLGLTDWRHSTLTATLREAISRKDGRRHYLRVRLTETADGLEARLTGDQGSGILTSMVEGDGLAVIPEDVDELAAGSPVQVIPLR